MKNKPYRYILYLGLRLLQLAVWALPRRAGFFLAGGLAALAFQVLGRERQKTIRHLMIAWGGEKDPAELRRIARRVFIHFGESAVDALRIPRMNREEADRLVEAGDGFERIDRVLAEGKGMILLTAHFGNWELMGAVIMLKGYKGTVVGRRIYYDKFNEAILNLRGSMALRTIYQDASPREFLRVLQDNQILGILADQDLDWAEGIFVPFFGRPAHTLTAPVKLALASGAPIVPVFLPRQGERYRLIVDDPIRVEMKGTREETIQEYTARWSRAVEKTIRAYPDQWAWMHRRWKTSPPEAEPARAPVSSGAKE